MAVLGQAASVLVQAELGPHLVERVHIVRVRLVITNSLSEVFLQPAVELVSCPSIAAFLERLHCLLIEGGGNEHCASLCAARAKLDGFNLGCGDVVSLVLAKIGKRSGRHVLIVRLVKVLHVGPWWNVHNCRFEKGVISFLASSLWSMKEVRSSCHRIRLSKVGKR